MAAKARIARQKYHTEVVHSMMEVQDAQSGNGLSDAGRYIMRLWTNRSTNHHSVSPTFPSEDPRHNTTQHNTGNTSRKVRLDMVSTLSCFVTEPC
jgi:hypothetical protein